MVARRALAIAALCAGLGCADAPFERANPNDRDFEVVLSLVRSRDTVSLADPLVVVRLVTNPVLAGYEPYWYSSSSLLVSEGDGVFRVQSAPGGVTPVQVQARFSGRIVSTIIHVAPSL